MTAARFLAGVVVLSGFLLPGAQAPAAPAKEVTRANLGNGLRVVVVRDPLAPVVTTVMNYLAGSNEAPPGFPGMAHALEHMMFRGSQDLSADQLAAIAASMGGNFNADTQQSVTQFFFTVPKQDLDVALHIESIRMQNLLATDALWDKERGAIEQEVARDLSNPQYVFYTDLLSAMFRGTPYAHDALGTRPSFDATTGAMLQQFHKRWYAPNNAILVIAGDVDPDKTLAQVTDLFGKVPAGALPARPQIRLNPIQPETLHLATDLPYGLAVKAFRWPGSRSPDFATAQVLADVLSSQRGTLYDLVPQGKALAADFSFDDLPQAGLGYGLAAFPAGGDGTGLLGQVAKILGDIAQKGVPADLVETAKRREHADAEFEKNSISGLAMLWSRAVAVEGRQSPEEDITAIEKVTPEDVNKLARKLLDQQGSMSAILTPRSSGKPTTSSSFGGSESFAATPTAAVSLPSWARNVNELSIPLSMVHPTVTTLRNGLKLIVQPETISDSINVFGYIRSNEDLESPTGQEGVNEMLDQLFSYGTDTLDRVAFQKALDDIAANESAGTDFSLEVLANQFDRGVELLAQNELRPALPETAFKIAQQQLAASVKGELESPGYLTQHALKSALLPKDDPDLRHATPGSVTSLTLADVRRYHQRVFRPDLTTIVVMGKVTPEMARTVIERYFGAWKAEGPKPPTFLPAVPANRASSTNVPNISRVQDEVTLAETVPLTRSSPDYYPLNLGNQVLGGSFYASRLSRDLRETNGLVYTIASRLEAGPKRSFYTVSYGCDPPNVARARAIIERDLKDMQTTAVTAGNLLQAKVLLLQQIPLSESSFRGIGGGLLSRTRDELPLNEPELAAQRYVKMTAQEVQAAFRRWVRPESLVQVTEGPTPE